MVWLVLLLDLFLICREPRCGDYVDRANIKTSFKGAALTITSTCNSNHTTQVYRPQHWVYWYSPAQREQELFRHSKQPKNLIRLL